MSSKITSELSEMVSLLYVPVPDQETARSIAKHLVEQRLAVCVNVISNMESFFEWQGKIQHIAEYLLIIKVMAIKIAIVKKQLQEMHPYQAPFIGEIRLADVNNSFLDNIQLLC